ncbi:Glyoxalase/Bleomycin resistance protein/Dioxygenase superfamily protein [Methylacidimicrobium sp. AP8]|uniref:VOC family protein n=1 Tax=Methylacidimicrobium sp. AP8 TaxID=2730359 RepID=UPI0018C06C40|nr:VOC family protein [Methylacidimicrobium sp. AP8]CAB4243799.1 Glyoxalase/Bleomycin resistance protein/Dioxygenase superfamily protein [Methylacidimicrobium sp. AP8]
MESAESPLLSQINLIVREMDASIAFYRRLGLDIRRASAPDWAPHHAEAVLPGGVRLEIDTVAGARRWNPGGRPTPGGGNLLFFRVRSRRAVDDLFASLTGAGYRAQKEPEDGFWGARYAILEDPDGNPVGIMSPVDPALRRPPPPAPPTG